MVQYENSTQCPYEVFYLLFYSGFKDILIGTIQLYRINLVIAFSRNSDIVDKSFQVLRLFI